jgi:hypothetical protein
MALVKLGYETPLSRAAEYLRHSDWRFADGK